jgi:hypothetical protein
MIRFSEKPKEPKPDLATPAPNKATVEAKPTLKGSKRGATKHSDDQREADES